MNRILQIAAFACALVAPLAPAQTLSDVGIVSFRGTYSSSRTYTKGDEVAYNGLLYVSTGAGNLNSTPGTNSSWQLMPGGVPPAASSTQAGVAQLATGTANTTAENVANKGVASGYAPLDSASKLPVSNLPTTAEVTTNKGAANGYAPLDSAGKVPSGNLPTPTSGVTLQHNGTANGSQTKLNIVQGTNVTVADDGSGNVTINSTATGSGSIPGTANQTVVSNGSNGATATPFTIDPTTGNVATPGFFGQNATGMHAGLDTVDPFSMTHSFSGSGRGDCNGSGCATSHGFLMTNFFSYPGQNIGLARTDYYSSNGDGRDSHKILCAGGDSMYNAEWCGGENQQIWIGASANYFQNASTGTGITTLTGLNQTIPVGQTVFGSAVCAGTVSTYSGAAYPLPASIVTCSSNPLTVTTNVQSASAVSAGTNVTIPIATGTPPAGFVNSLSSPGTCTAGAVAGVADVANNGILSGYEQPSVISTTSTSITVSALQLNHSAGLVIGCGVGYGVEMTANTNVALGSGNNIGGSAAVQLHPIAAVVAVSGSAATVLHAVGPEGSSVAIPAVTAWATGSNGANVYRIATVLSDNPASGVATLSPNRIAQPAGQYLGVSYGTDQRISGPVIDMESRVPTIPGTHGLRIYNFGYTASHTADGGFYYYSGPSVIPGSGTGPAFEADGAAGSGLKIDNAGMPAIEVQDDGCLTGGGTSQNLTFFHSGSNIVHQCGNNTTSLSIAPGGIVYVPGANFGLTANTANFTANANVAGNFNVANQMVGGVVGSNTTLSVGNGGLLSSSLVGSAQFLNGSLGSGANVLAFVGSTLTTGNSGGLQWWNASTPFLALDTFGSASPLKIGGTYATMQGPLAVNTGATQGTLGTGCASGQDLCGPSWHINHDGTSTFTSTAGATLPSSGVVVATSTTTSRAANSSDITALFGTGTSVWAPQYVAAPAAPTSGNQLEGLANLTWALHGSDGSLVRLSAGEAGHWSLSSATSTTITLTGNYGTTAPACWGSVANSFQVIAVSDVTLTSGTATFTINAPVATTIHGAWGCTEATQ